MLPQIYHACAVYHIKQDHVLKLVPLVAVLSLDQRVLRHLSPVLLPDSLLLQL